MKIQDKRSLTPALKQSSAKVESAKMDQLKQVMATNIVSSTNNVDNSSTTNLAAPMTSRQTFADARPGSAL